MTAPDADGVVLMRMRTEFLDTGAAGAGAVVEGTAVEGTVVKAEQRLQFRSAAQVRADLDAVGLTVERISGDWHRTPFVEATDRLMGVEARKA
ncbi:hypothetical protein [Micrococcus endophyticus]|uniref:Uncharacterized protein n=1 Tax=Micrococcus endophyticus TaxID=455343 RepID=A0A4Y8YQK1_9MICC|nr:hypothetical protein [Micrococcus endophyticus]MBB5849424.1 hypothetical protein [Micrococcus endophyticus]TFI40241.1 hypothetical protein E4A41_11025 [Micrococcus endophyticus]